MKFAKIVFLIAGFYGIVVVAPLYFAEGLINTMNPPAITHPEYYYGFVGVTLAWQIVFIILSRDPLRYRVMMLPAVIEKATFSLGVLVLFLQHRISSTPFVMGTVDMLLGILFLIAYIKTAQTQVQQSALSRASVH